MPGFPRGGGGGGGGGAISLGVIEGCVVDSLDVVLGCACDVSAGEVEDSLALADSFTACGVESSAAVMEGFCDSWTIDFSSFSIGVPLLSVVAAADMMITTNTAKLVSPRLGVTTGHNQKFVQCPRNRSNAGCLNRTRMYAFVVPGLLGIDGAL